MGRLAGCAGAAGMVIVCCGTAGTAGAAGAAGATGAGGIGAGLAGCCGVCATGGMWIAPVWGLAEIEDSGTALTLGFPGFEADVVLFCESVSLMQLVGLPVAAFHNRHVNSALRTPIACLVETIL